MSHPSELQQWQEYLHKVDQQELTLADIKKQSVELANTVIQYTAEHSPFYREHLKNGLKEVSSIKVLDQIPFTHKDDLRKAGLDICSMDFDHIAMYYETTGTTGIPTPCPRAAIDVETSSFYVERSMANIYHDTFGTTAALTAIMGPSELYAFGDTYGEACRKLGIPFVRLWPESPRVGLEKAANLIHRLQVKSLICSPAVAMALARFFQSQNIDPRTTQVKQIMVLGELCTSAMLQSIARIWNAHCTHGLYGSQEAHAVATGCSQGNLHLSETNYIAEILPHPDIYGSDSGELCLTMLVPGAKPLVRFRTGDLVQVQNTPCACGNPHRTIKVLGRAADVMQLGGRTVMPATIESAILGSVDCALGYQVDIQQQGNQERVQVSLVTRTQPGDINAVQEAISAQLNVPVELKIEDELDSRTETGAYISWKHARILDHRS